MKQKSGKGFLKRKCPKTIYKKKKKKKGLGEHMEIKNLQKLGANIFVTNKIRKHFMKRNSRTTVFERNSDNFVHKYILSAILIF